MPEETFSDDGVWDPGESSGEPITPFDRRVWRALAKGGQWLPKEHKSYMVDYLSMNQPLIPVSQLVGFDRFTAQLANVLTDENTTSTSYVNLTTTGPSLSGLSEGAYIVLFGAQCVPGAGEQGAMSVSVNGAAASDDDAAFSSATNATLCRALAVTLTDPTSNEIVTKYRTNVGGAATRFLRRWIIALRYANA